LRYYAYDSLIACKEPRRAPGLFLLLYAGLVGNIALGGPILCIEAPAMAGDFYVGITYTRLTTGSALRTVRRTVITFATMHASDARPAPPAAKNSAGTFADKPRNVPQTAV